MTDVPLDILIVEDSEDDALLIRLTLQRGGLPIGTYRRVDTEPAFVEALEQQPWHVILSDCSIPGFGAPRALELLRATGRDTPFLLISGKIGEEAAVEIMRRGANDFLPKDNLTRLIPAIRREIEEAEQRCRRRTAERKLLESEEKFRNLFQHASDAIFYHEPDGTIVEANAMACSRLGIPHEILIGRRLHDFVPALHRSMLDTQLKNLAQVGRGLFEISLRTAAGGEYCAECSSKKIAHCGATKVLTIARDITGRKKAERHIVRLSNMYAALSETNQAIIRIPEPTALLQEICRISREYGHFDMAWIVFRSEDGGGTSVEAANGITPKTVHALLDESPELRRLMREVWDCPGQENDHRASERTRSMEESNWRVDNQFPVAALERALGHEIHRPFGSIALFSLEQGGRCVGCLSLYAWEPDFFEEDLIELLKQMANDISFALDYIDQEARRRHDEEALRLSATVFENSSEGILISDADNRIISVNRAFCRITGYSPEEVLGQNPRILNSGRQSREFYEHLWQALATQGHWQGELINRRKDGSVFPEWLSINSVIRDHRVTHYIGIFSDITERKEAEERIRYLALFDPLTKLPNRVLLQNRLELFFAMARRRGTRIAVLFLDLDRFKTINDSLGHDVGDLLLQEVATRIRNCVRETDLVTRWGGDEFVVAFENSGHLDQVTEVIQKIVEAIGRGYLLRGHKLVTTTSVGISLFPEDGEDINTLIKHADLAMYEAKERGRNTYQFFHPEMNRTAMERLSIQNDLRQAMERDELFLVYQPQLDLSRGTIAGVEALVRWRHPEKGLVPPDCFIPIAEDSGLIVPLGRWILETACRQAVAWRRAESPSLVLSINLSPVQFRQPDFISMVRNILNRIDLAPLRLEFEITERLWLQEVDAALQMQEELRGMGVQMAIDDFGTGYSNLGYLKRLPIDRLKIDRSFVQDTPRDANAGAIVAAIINMAHSLHMTVVAEGVETQEQLAFLREQGCEQIQGYLFSYPEPPENIARLLEQTAASPVLAL